MAGERILVVDDNPLNLKMTRLLLVGEGYDVRTAEDSQEALAVLAVFRPHLILMDIRMPGMDGLELTRRLRADPATQDVIIVALTANAMRGDEESAREAGCNGYIAKPIDTRSLPQFLRRYLTRAAP
ncbi:MAG: response regulator [Acidobacteria bacterium]|nr:response regulator [Acidobacteriota bacterium]